MITRVLMVAWLAFVWVALWGEPSAANAVAGILVGLALITVFPPSRQMSPVVRPLAFAHFAAVFAWRLVVASAVVAWEVLTPRNRIREGIIAVQLTSAPELVMTIVANSVSLTPGTLTLDIDRSTNTMYMHVLHLREIEAARRDVHELERLAILAFADRATIDSMDRVSPRSNGDPPWRR
ncbi:MAG TPA: Na+/H+ antiporter subunit E [Acidimicrobiales bacterium]|nr:Na+/H+ antiporter subunit E [Acidimicrobiales bacterium]